MGKTVRLTRLDIGIRFTRMDAADVLSIALGHRQHGCVDEYAFTAPLRSGTTTLLAHRQRYLVTGTACVPWSTQRLSSQQEQGRVVVEPPA